MKKEITISDSVLVAAYQKGNKNVLPLLVERWHLLFCKLAFFYVKDADIAKDIAQESWIVIIHKMKDLRSPEKCKSWAISIVNRKAIDCLRKTNRERVKLESIYNESSATGYQENIDDEALKIKIQLLKGISQLSINQQEVIQLFYKQGYSLKEISTIMSTTVSVTKSRLFHAREKLKTILKHRTHEK